MNHLHRTGEIEQAGLIGAAAKVARRQHQQQRTHPLARHQRAFAHRRINQILLLARRQQLIEAGLQRLAQRL